jgi:catechol 2,3-dioxygenase-like lactoylglutathione lyase family enzyme
MKSLFAKLGISLFCITLPLAAQTSSTVIRPRITGISHIAVYTSDPEQSRAFYAGVIGCAARPDPEQAGGTRYSFNSHQSVEVLPLPSNPGVNRLDHIAFSTTDAEMLRRYLADKGIQVPDNVTRGRDGFSQWFEVKDPEGNIVQFVQQRSAGIAVRTAVGRHIIHVGMLIHSRDASDHFYQEVLGFRPYWHGGMQPDKTDWVAMQVPDGTDWLEYMLTSGPSGSGIPANMSQHSLGVLNHFSVGVVDINQAADAVHQRAGWDKFPHDKGPQLGKDGKNQYNIYDADQTRVEFMEFAPVAKPCCSDFTGQHPSPFAD